MVVVAIIACSSSPQEYGYGKISIKRVPTFSEKLFWVCVVAVALLTDSEPIWEKQSSDDGSVPCTIIELGSKRSLSSYIFGPETDICVICLYDICGYVPAKKMKW